MPHWNRSSGYNSILYEYFILLLPNECDISQMGLMQGFQTTLRGFFFLSYVHTGTATLNFSLQYQIKIHVKLIGLEIAAHLWLPKHKACGILGLHQCAINRLTTGIMHAASRRFYSGFSINQNTQNISSSDKTLKQSASCHVPHLKKRHL